MPEDYVKNGVVTELGDDETVLRNCSKRGIKKGRVFATAFEHRPQDPGLSWHVARPPLNSDEGIERLRCCHYLPKSQTLPGIAALTARELRAHDINIKMNEGPEVFPGSLLPNPFFRHHCTSDLIIDELVREKLASIATLVRSPETLESPPPGMSDLIDSPAVPAADSAAEAGPPPAATGDVEFP